MLFPQYKWLSIKDGHPLVAQMYRRHYSSYNYRDNRRDNVNYNNRNLVVGPGERMVLVTPDFKAVFIWRKFIDDSGQTGVNCAMFRNEGAFDGDILSSELILEAEQLAHNKWPGERFYTYVNTKAVNGDGYCFKCAGWKKVGRTKVNNLLILEKAFLPQEYMPREMWEWVR